LLRGNHRRTLVLRPVNGNGQPIIVHAVEGSFEPVRMILDPNDLKKLKVTKYKRVKNYVRDENRNKIQEKCLICLEEFQRQDKNRILPCDHNFHKTCIDEMLTKYSYKCPICRTEAGRGVRYREST